MPNGARILAFSGSARRESLNKKLLAVAVEATRAAGAEVTLHDFKEFPIPMYDGDLEDAEGIPANAQKLIELVRTQAPGAALAIGVDLKDVEGYRHATLNGLR